MLPLLFCLAMSQSYNPNLAETKLVWAIPVSLATTSGITFVFFSYGYLDVSVPHVRLPLKMEWYNLLVSGCPIRKSADRFVFANPHSLSQLITSFIAFQSLGIPHVPLFTFFSPTGYESIMYKYKINYPGLINTSVFCSLIYELFSLVVTVYCNAINVTFFCYLLLFYFIMSKIASKLMLWELSDTESNRECIHLFCIRMPPNGLQT